MIRFFIRAMHNRTGPAVESKEICALELGVIAPLVAIVIALGVYPQVLLEATEKGVEGVRHQEASVISEAPPVGDVYEPENLQAEPGGP
jgi:NADH:ubiquinone oxidoreductase subunit 4 (subunit M)